MHTLIVNGRTVHADAAADTPLLWVLRDTLGLPGTRYGCGAGQCGACTVLLDGAAVRSCMTPVGTVAGLEVTTIEGLGDRTGPAGPALQRAWEALNVPQCGFCQSGQLMQACALLRNKPRPSVAEIGAAMEGNLCRCGTYARIHLAVARAADDLATGGKA